MAMRPRSMCCEKVPESRSDASLMRISALMDASRVLNQENDVSRERRHGRRSIPLIEPAARPASRMPIGCRRVVLRTHPISRQQRRLGASPAGLQR